MENFLFELSLLPPLFIAAALGFFIGFERKWRAKEAGLRTHTIIAVSTALITLISIHGFTQYGADVSRVAAQLVPGIGFLGAGIIVYRQHEVKGLTTAAGVLSTAGVGMACGCQMYVLAVAATLIIIAVQFVLHMNVKLFRVKRVYSVHVEFLQTQNGVSLVKEIFGVAHFNDLTIHRDGDAVIYCATLSSEKRLLSDELSKIMQTYPFITSVTRCENT